MKKVILTFATFALALNLLAQAPQKFSYQAVVRDNTNSLKVNSPIGMQVSLLQGSISGSAVFVETHSTTTNANGLVTVEIGGGTNVSGSFSAIDWSNGPYFI